MKIRLSRLAPRWIILKVKETPDGVPHICEEEDGIKRYGLGLTFDCPLHRRIHRITVFFENPLDGLPPPHGVALWKREGESFETLTLSPPPGVNCLDCWIGFINNGEVS